MSDALRSTDPLCFVILFPTGEDGWHLGLKHTGGAKNLSPRQHYSFHIQYRLNSPNVLLTSCSMSTYALCMPRWEIKDSVSFNKIYGLSEVRKVEESMKMLPLSTIRMISGPEEKSSYHYPSLKSQDIHANNLECNGHCKGISQAGSPHRPYLQSSEGKYCALSFSLPTSTRQA